MIDRIPLNRRSCLPMLAAVPFAAALPARAEPVQVVPRTFVLIHGAWFGGWCWVRVAEALRSKGHRVYVPSLTGLGDRAHLAGPAVTLSTHVADVLDVLESEELNNVVLVGHSYAGVPCAMAAEKASDRIGRLVFLDSVLPEDGKPLSALSTPSVWEARVAAAKASTANGFPPPPIGAFGVADEQQVAWLQRQLRPQPIGSYIEAPKLTGATRTETVYVSCEGPAMAAIDPFRAVARSRKDWRVETIAASHACMITSPELTAETLMQVAG